MRCAPQPVERRAHRRASARAADAAGSDTAATVATDPFFWQAFRHTAIYTAVLVPVQLILTLALALVLNNPKLPLRNLFRTVYFLPIVTSILVVGVVMRFMLQALGQNLPQFVYDTGLVNPARRCRRSSATSLFRWPRR